MNEVLRQQVLNALEEAGLPASSLDKLIDLHEALTGGGSGPLNWFDLVDTVVKGPSLLARRPDTLASKAPYVLAIAEAIGKPTTISAGLDRFPTALSYGSNHLHLRYILAKTGHATALATVITMPSRDAEQKAIALYAWKDRTLQVMHAKGLIKELPDGVRPLQRGDAPLSRQGLAVATMGRVIPDAEEMDILE